MVRRRLRLHGDLDPLASRVRATSAQCAWAYRWAADSTALLIGTIDRHNYASRATAQRAVRPRVLDNVFISLD